MCAAGTPTPPPARRRPCAPAWSTAGARARPDLLQLLFLHVSRGYRDQGLGARLARWALGQAAGWGARGLYISATPTEHTIRFYLGLGCRPLAEPDPQLLAEEPEDIHLELLAGR